VHIERTGRFRIALSLARAFSLLSPEGEKLWVPGWRPVYLHPHGTPSAAAHTVFTTDHSGEHTVWMVLQYSAQNGVAEYLRLTPGSRVGTVSVAGSERGGGTDVDVTYRLTSLSPAGEAALTAMTGDAYQRMLAEWETRIAAVAPLP
jgi:hypothetical protein